MDTPIFEELVKARYRLAQEQLAALKQAYNVRNPTPDGQAWVLEKARHERAVMDDLIRIANMHNPREEEPLWTSLMS